MPSKKVVNSSPVKASGCEELLDHPWCVTERLGLYVQVYNNEEPVKGKEANDVLSRIGFINGVSWSGVYAREGKSVNVFKFEIETKGSTGVTQTGEGKTMTYVVSEENFTDFSCDHYRTNYLKEGETGCENVDQDLVDAWCAPNKTKNGSWLKKWVNTTRGGDAEASATTVRTQARMPGVFGDDGQATQNSQATANKNTDNQNDESASSVPPAPAKSPPTNRQGASSSSNVNRTGSGSVGLLGANVKPMVNAKVNTFFTPQKKNGPDDDADNASMGSFVAEVVDSDEDNSTDSDAPKKKKGKHTKEDALQSRKVTKKADKKAEKDSPAGKQKGAKLALKQMDEDKRKAVAVGIAAWADKHRVKSSNIVNGFGKHVFPTAWLQTAGDMAAREVKDKNTKTVDDSIRVLGKIDSMTNVELLIFSDQLRAAGFNPRNLVFDTTQPKPDIDLSAIVGAHTVTSIGKSHKARPNHAAYQFIHCSLLVCEDTPENRSMAKAYGALENKVKDNRSKTDTWDQIWTMHQSYVNLVNTIGLDNKKVFKKAWVNEKARLDVATRTGSKGSFDQNITIAQRTGPVFDLIAKIFKGEVANLKSTDKPVKPPTGVGHFKMMGGIPDEKLLEWLQRVVQGDEETKDFAQNCMRFKQKLSIKEAIVEYIQVVRDRTNLTWEEVVDEWPNIGDETWFELLMGWVGAVTTVVLTNSIKEEILNRLLLDEQNDDDDNQSSQSGEKEWTLKMGSSTVTCYFGDAKKVAKLIPRGYYVLLISDTPYGVTDEVWDKVWTKADLLLILKQFVASNKAQEWAVFFWHTPYQTAMFLDVLSEMGYTEAQQLYWHKTGQTSQTPVAMHTSSVEMGTLAFYPARQKNSVNLHRDPRYRHNHIEHPNVSKKFKDSSGVIANPCQKPEGVTQWIIGSVCMPGSTVLVVGPGAGGGEVLGAVLSGCHVVAVEKNKYQFENLQANLLHIKEKMAKAQLAKEEAAGDEKNEVKESQEFSAGAQYSQSNAMSDEPAKTEVCGSCGLDLEGESFVCSVDACAEADPRFHQRCTVIINGAPFCVDCNRNAEDEASQAATQDVD